MTGPTKECYIKIFNVNNTNTLIFLFKNVRNFCNAFDMGFK